MSIYLDSSKRTIDDLRNIVIKKDIIKSALGSAYYEMQNTKIFACVHGPQNESQLTSFSSQRDKQQLLIDVKYSPFAYKSTRLDKNQVIFYTLRWPFSSRLKTKNIKSVLIKY